MRKQPKTLTNEWGSPSSSLTSETFLVFALREGPNINIGEVKIPSAMRNKMMTDRHQLFWNWLRDYRYRYRLVTDFNCLGMNYGLPLPTLIFWSELIAVRIAVTDTDFFFCQRIAKGAGGKGPLQKTSKIVKKCQKYFRHFSTIFAQGKKRQKSSKRGKKFFDSFRAAPFFRPLLQSADFGNLDCYSHLVTNTVIN